MGFLDNLLRRAVDSAVDAVTDGVINAVLGKDGQAGENAASAAAGSGADGNGGSRGNTAGGTGGSRDRNSGSAASGSDAVRENKAATGQGNCSGERLLRQRIEEIAAREKPEYELRQRVPSSQVGAPKGAEPHFDYGFYRDGMLVAVIQILEGNNAYCRKSVRLAQQACEERQVAYMNLMSYMTNRPEYIARRLKENLR